MPVFHRIKQDITDYALRQHWFVCVIVAGLFGYILFRHLNDGMYASIFGGLNLGVHEFGHMITGFGGQTFSIFGGTLVQCLLPLGSIIMFYRQGELAGIPFCFGWLGTNLFNVATYVGDARMQNLDLVSPWAGGPIIHDWNFLLTKWHLLESDHAIAAGIRSVAFISLWLSVLGAITLLVFMIRIRTMKDEE